MFFKTIINSTYLRSSKLDFSFKNYLKDILLYFRFKEEDFWNKSCLRRKYSKYKKIQILKND